MKRRMNNHLVDALNVIDIILDVCLKMCIIVLWCQVLCYAVGTHTQVNHMKSTE